jgi:hypothetical protein
LRCQWIKGYVVEGDHEPCCVGSFEMRLAMSAVEDMDALASRYRRRLEAKPAPPPRFRKAGFVDTWRMLLTLESDGGLPGPKLLSIRLRDDGVFESAAAPLAEGPRLSGRWGIWDDSLVQVVGRKAAQRLHEEEGKINKGTHVWLHFVRGLGMIGQNESFSAHGRPKLTSFAQELQSKGDEGADSDRVDGGIYYGSSSDREYYLAGRFTLIRDSDDFFAP